MKKSFIAVAALILSAVAVPTLAAQTSSGNCKAFYHGATSPSQLAGYIEASLAQDPSGRTLLSRKKCNDDGSCGTPLLYVEAIEKAYAKAGKPSPFQGTEQEKLKQLAPYLKTLIQRRGPSGRHWVSGIRYRQKDPYVDMQCVQREVTDLVWVDPKVNLAILDQFCTNPFDLPVVPPVASTPVISQPPVSAKCPDGYTLTANAWTYESIAQFPAFRNELDALVAAASAADSQNANNLAAYDGPRLSRTMGGRLRKEVQTRAPLSVDLQIRFVDEGSPAVTRDIGVLHVKNGVGTYHFRGDPRSMIIEVTWPSTFLSPTLSGGAHRLRVFSKEWGDICGLNVHGVLRRLQAPAQ